MFKKILFYFVMFLIPCFCIGCFCSTKQLSCADGDPVVIQTCPKKQYEDYARSFEFNLRANINFLEKVNIADLDTGGKRSITQLREKLSQYSGQSRDILHASYLAINSAPCDKGLKKEHMDLLSKINKQTTALAKLVAELKAPVTPIETPQPDGVCLGLEIDCPPPPLPQVRPPPKILEKIALRKIARNENTLKAAERYLLNNPGPLF